MPANVRSTDTIRELRTALLEFASRLDEHLFGLRSESRRVLEWATIEQPRYWRHQVTLAERNLQEALDHLATSQATYGGRDRPRATEARQRVHSLRARLRFCQDRLAACRGWAAEIERAVDQFLAATSGLQQQAETGLPTAAEQLARWIDSLDRYADTRPPQGQPASPASESPQPHSAPAHSDDRRPVADESTSTGEHPS